MFYKAYINDNTKFSVKYVYKYFYFKNYPCLIIIKYFDNNWLLMSNEKKTFPILAYSDEKSYSEEIPPNVLFWFNFYSEIVLKSKENNTSIDTMWQYLLKLKNLKFTHSGIEPLISTKWGQSVSNDGLDVNAYNFYCPAGNNCDHTLVGCPATAAGQIIKFLRYPDCIEFNYNIMPDELKNSDSNYDIQKKEIANLLRNIGDKMNLNADYFGCNASGTNKDIIFNVLKNDFSFSNAQIVDRNDYSINQWKSKLINELENQRPILYMGFTSNHNGHAFVCDGYKDVLLGKKFHFNFGWNGLYDGYYRVNNPCGYSYNQYAIINLYSKNCNTYIEINNYYKYLINKFSLYYNPVAGNIHSSPSFVILEENEIVNYKAYNEIILENFETTDNSEFIAEIVPCYYCNFIDYKNINEMSEINKNYDISLNNENNINNKINVFPNPFTNILTITYSSNINVLISLIDIYGKYIFKNKSFNFNSQLNLEDLKEGIYILEINDKKNVTYLKIIKQ
ncbi:MAG: C10 family peptidase [Bacteroidales bacterium]|nr:C10 family peptidase [Bacteroidales bacterium]